MIDPPKYAPTTGERCRHRDEQAREFLEGRTGWSRGWSRFHLWLGNAADTAYAVTNNEYLAAGMGGAIGFARGLMIGLPLAFLALAIAPPLIIAPVYMLTLGTVLIPAAATSSMMGAGMLLTGGFFALKDGGDFYRAAQKDAAVEKAGKIGDKIAATGKAISSGPTKVQLKTIERLKEEGSIGHHYEERPPPEKGINHRYNLAKKREAELVSEGKGV